jgi:hypothetical protein
MALKVPESSAEILAFGCILASSWEV